MKSIERDVMLGMINILNQAIESKQCETPIMSDETINIRLADLKEFEDETGIVFVNSPNCKIDLESVVNIQEVKKDNLKECKDITEIIEYANQKEMIAYLDIVGTDVIVTYRDGCLSNIQSNYSNDEKIIKRLNLPYNIKKEGVYSVKAKVVHTDEPSFYVNDILEGGSDNFRDDLNEAKNLNFNVVPFWIANDFNPNKLKDAIDYVLEYAKEDNLECDGVSFKFNKKNLNNVLSFVGCCYKC